MNLEEFPNKVKNDIEDQSLSILSIINKDIVVIGGWAVRALLGENHGRYTLDVDGVFDSENLSNIEKKLKKAGFDARENDWGIQFFHKYKPNVPIEGNIIDEVKKIELRIEISGPRIKEADSRHYFEFSLKNYVKKKISFHNNDEKVLVYAPSPEDMAAVKLGLPADYKNNYDASMLLTICDVDKVIERIKLNDDWSEMVLRRLPKSMGRIKNKDRIENILALKNGINITKHIELLNHIQNELS